MLGTTLGKYDGEKFIDNQSTSFGSGAKEGFFTGKPHVAGLGYAFLFRNYRPGLGKWQTADPLGYPDGLNNFAYCNNGVTDSVDFLGLVDWDQVVSGTLGVVGGAFEAAGGAFLVANFETCGTTQVIGAVVFTDGLGNIGIGIANIATGFADQPGLPPTFAHVLASAVSQEGNIDINTANGVATITNYALGLATPVSAISTTFTTLSNTYTAASAIRDTIIVYNNLTE